MPISVPLFRKLEEVEPHLRGVLLSILEEIERQRKETVTKDEFADLRDIVKDLAGSQHRTELQMSELVEAQKRTESVVSELGAAVRELAAQQADTRKEVGGLSITVGYQLEDLAYKHLPTFLKREFDLKVEGELTRDFIKDYQGKPIEINILGYAVRNGDRFLIVGESKAQLSKNKVDDFFRKKINRLTGVYKEEIFPILVTYMKTEPEVDEFARNKGIKRVYYTYEFKT